MSTKPASAYAMIPGQVWDGIHDRPRLDRAVIIENDIITDVIGVKKLPSGIRRIDLPGTTLMPGLIDCHVHFCDWMRPAFLAAGVTTIRDVGNDLAWILERREYARRHPTRSPRILCCGPLLDGPVAHWPIMGRPHADRADMEASVKSVIDHGVDAVKLYVNVTREQMDGAIDVSHRHDRHILAHLGGITAEQTAEAGLDEIEHLSGCGAAWHHSPPEEIDALCDTLLASNMVMCPTLVVWDRIARVCDLAYRYDQRLKWVVPAFLKAWAHYPWRYDGTEKRLELQRNVVDVKRCLNRMYERGMTIIAGTDTPFPYLIPGFSLHDELALMVDAGMPPIHVLYSATINAARVLRIDHSVGTIEPGKCADLLVVQGDPTVDIHAVGQVQQVIRGGKPLRLSTLRDMSRRLLKKTPEDPVCRDILGYIARQSPHYNETITHDYS